MTDEVVARPTLEEGFYIVLFDGKTYTKNYFGFCGMQ